MKYITVFAIILFSLNLYTEKIYQKDYFDNGTLAAEGWIENNQKVDFWKSYYSNGILKSEGHYNKGLKTQYWHYYRNDGTKKK